MIAKVWFGDAIRSACQNLSGADNPAQHTGLDVAIFNQNNSQQSLLQLSGDCAFDHVFYVA
jgi:hypothetical protein